MLVVAAAGPVGALLATAGAQQSAAPAGAPAAQAAPAAATSEASEPVFDKAFMTSAENIKGGESIWANQCRHCHGHAAYPGKAPKLNPALLEPDFIFDRVTNGFQKMPAWKDIFSREERMNVVAYIKSRQFSP